MSYRHCSLYSQGYSPCGNVISVNGEPLLPCKAGLRVIGGEIHRLVYDVVLSRPEDYLSIYQSCCNHNCLMCHSWYFTQYARGSWMSPSDLMEKVREYYKSITVWEPRSRSLMWYSSDLCIHCGKCVVEGVRSRFCPNKLRREQVLLSPQGYGPARNIVSFTGGDLYCQPAYYVRFFKMVKRDYSDLWMHIETNGYGLTRKNLELLYEAGLDSIWLDLKACSSDTYRRLCGTSNEWILELPALIRDYGLVLEIVLLYIPGFVELEEMHCFGRLLASIDKDLPVTLLAFFPEYMLRGYRSPTLDEMIRAYRVLESYGLRRVRIGNIGVFCKSINCIDELVREIGRDHLHL